MEIDYTKFENSETLEKLFSNPILELEKSNLLVSSEIPNILNLLLSFDELFTKLKERTKFYKDTFKKVKDNKIIFYKSKKKYLSSVAFENETLEYKKNVELFECDYKIKNLEMSKFYKSFNLNEEGEIISNNDFNLIKLIRDMQNIINQNSFTPTTRIRLQNMVTTPTSTETLKDVIFGMLKNEEEKTARTITMKKN